MTAGNGSNSAEGDSNVAWQGLSQPVQEFVNQNEYGRLGGNEEIEFCKTRDGHR
jgi:hypothetical protein